MYHNLGTAYQNLSTTSEAEMAFRQAIDSVGDAERREQLRQAYIQVETQTRTYGWYRFAQHGTDQFLSTAIEMSQTALVKFFLAEYNWRRWFSVPPQIVGSVITSGNLELLNWLLNDAPAWVRDQCWLSGLTFYGAIQKTLERAQLAVVKCLYEAYKQAWQAEYTTYGNYWIMAAAERRQLEIVRFLLTRDNTEQVMSSMKFRDCFNPRTEVKSKVFVVIIETIIHACAEIRSKKLIDLFIGKVKEYIAEQPLKEQPGLQILVKRTMTMERSKLQHQRASFAGLIDAISETLETKIATYNPAKK